MEQQKIPFDGFGNVIEMLRHADVNFREKILRNIAARNPEMAERLLEAVNRVLAEDRMARSKSELRRSQNSASVRNYGSNK